MNKLSSLLLQLLIIGKSMGNNNIAIFETTNYTLSYFKNLNSTSSCKTSNDCLPGANCSNGNCIFGTFWCKEDENEKCIMIDDKHYDGYNEKLKNLKNEPKPFLTTCSKNSIDESNCITPKCSENSDCYSNLCYKNNCIADKNIYYCKGNLNNVNCKKQTYMTCNNNTECLLSNCTEGICQSKEQKSKLNVTLYIIFGLLILLIALVDYFMKVKNKKERKERKEREIKEKLEMKEKKRNKNKY